ncbi:MAG: signal peptidase II [Candidatus Rokubacteria bacterium]|nr:signal peptidase II [Candidatus Rokubacteria bacterium]
MRAGRQGARAGELNPTAATSRVAILAAVIVALDQITKLVILDRLPPGTRIEVVDGLLALTLVMNPGLAFGLLANLPLAWRWVVAALSIVALLVLARVAVRVLPGSGWIDLAAIGLIFGGAVGNLVDRARFGAVVDFIDVYYRAWHWPAFNVADSAISVGVVLLALRLLRPPVPTTTA